MTWKLFNLFSYKFPFFCFLLIIFLMPLTEKCKVLMKRNTNMKRAGKFPAKSSENELDFPLLFSFVLHLGKGDVFF